MGYPGKNRKQYETPTHRFEKTRLESETRLIIEFGLRNKKELWKAESTLRRYKRAARDLLALMSAKTGSAFYETRKMELLTHLQRMGLIGQDANMMMS
jgi:small subunit ribosomal protein S4